MKSGRSHQLNRGMYGPVLVLALFLSFFLSGCGFFPAAQGSGTPEGGIDTGFVPATPGNYDSKDQAVLVRKNTVTSQITFLCLEVGKFYTLNYDGATTYKDKYGSDLSLQQVQPGAIVDITFMKTRKRLNSLQIASQAYVTEHVKDFSFAPNGRSMTINGETFTLDEGAVILTDEGVGEPMDISDVDVLRINRLNHIIHSVVVEQGHGYLRLENAGYFEGGWVQVDDSIIRQVSEEMLMDVPVGTHTVSVSKGGRVGGDTIQVESGKEVKLDASEWITEPLSGKVVFTTVPEETKVYIDGETVDASKPVELTYGIHQMVATAKGYETVSRYIRVAQENANLNIILERDGSVSADSASGNSASGNEAPITATTSSNNVTDTASGNGAGNNLWPDHTTSGNGAWPDAAQTGNVSGNEAGSTSQNDVSMTTDTNVITPGEYRVYVDAPVGAEVYKDGNYVGIAPVSFKKEAGTYIITLRKNGCHTRSYTISVDGEKQNVNYSFSELQAIETGN